MNRLRSRLALAAFLAELGEAVEQAELVSHSHPTIDLTTMLSDVASKTVAMEMVSTKTVATEIVVIEKWFLPQKRLPREWLPLKNGCHMHTLHFLCKPYNCNDVIKCNHFLLIVHCNVTVGHLLLSRKP